MRVIRRSAGLVVALGLGLALVHLLAGPAEMAPTAQARARIAVAVYPDLAGPNPDDKDCAGCDREFTPEDSAANANAPLPPVEVVLLDRRGDEVERRTTSGLANGRQVTFFSVSSPADYTVEIEKLPGDWRACQEEGLVYELEADDFDRVSGFASADFYVWRGCRAPADEVEEPTVEPTAEEPETAGAAEEGEADETAEMAEQEEADETAEPEEADEAAATDDSAEPEEGEEAEDVDETAEADEAGAAEEDVAVEETVGGAVRGVVFIDVDGDGRLTEGESGVPEAKVQIMGLGVTQDTTTAGAGTYAFSGLEPGSYDVYLEVPTGYVTTTPDTYVGVTVADGVVLMGIDFGLAQAAAEGAEVPVEEQAAAQAEPTAEAEAQTPELPSTGVQFGGGSGVAVYLAALFTLLGTVGLALETRRGRRSHTTGNGGDDA